MYSKAKGQHIILLIILLQTFILRNVQTACYYLLPFDIKIVMGNVAFFPAVVPSTEPTVTITFSYHFQLFIFNNGQFVRILSLKFLKFVYFSNCVCWVVGFLNYRTYCVRVQSSTLVQWGCGCLSSSSFWSDRFWFRLVPINLGWVIPANGQLLNTHTFLFQISYRRNNNKYFPISILLIVIYSIVIFMF